MDDFYADRDELNRIYKKYNVDNSGIADEISVNAPIVDTINDAKTLITGKNIYGDPESRKWAAAGLLLPVAGSTLAGIAEPVLKKLDSGMIRYTQDSIKNVFSDGKSLDNLIDGLKNGSINSSDIPAINVFQKDGKIYSLDNRRLKAFKDAGVDVNINFVNPEDADIAEEITRKFTTKNDGTDIRIRGK